MLCYICHDTLSKIHYTLPCNHKVHFKCLNILDYYQPSKCPYCRQSFEEGISFRLRSRTNLLNNLKTKIKQVDMNEGKTEKIRIIIEIFVLLNENFRFIRYLKNNFLNIILFKINSFTSIVSLESTIPIQLKNTFIKEMSVTKEKIENIIN